MATSKHLAIRDAVAALYAGLAGDRIYENREYPLQQDVPSHIQVYRVDAQSDRPFVGATAPIDWTTTIRTVVKARKDATNSAEIAADTVMAACWARVMADQTLGGLVQLLESGGITWEQDEADSNVVMFTWDFQVQHRTEVNVIT